MNRKTFLTRIAASITAAAITLGCFGLTGSPVSAGTTAGATAATVTVKTAAAATPTPAPTAVAQKPLSETTYKPAERAAEAIKRAQPTKVTEYLGMPVATLIQYTDAFMQTLATNNEEWLPKQIAFNANSTYNEAVPEDAARFKKETGADPAKLSTVELVKKFYDWSLKNLKAFIGTNRQWHKR